MKRKRWLLAGLILLVLGVVACVVVLGQFAQQPNLRLVTYDANDVYWLLVDPNGGQNRIERLEARVEDLMTEVANLRLLLVDKDGNSVLVDGSGHSNLTEHYEGSTSRVNILRQLYFSWGKPYWEEGSSWRWRVQPTARVASPFEAIEQLFYQLYDGQVREAPAVYSGL
jgi:hypothetical protein